MGRWLAYGPRRGQGRERRRRGADGGRPGLVAAAAPCAAAAWLWSMAAALCRLLSRTFRSSVLLPRMARCTPPSRQHARRCRLARQQAAWLHSHHPVPACRLLLQPAPAALTRHPRRRAQHAQRSRRRHARPAVHYAVVGPQRRRRRRLTTACARWRRQRRWGSKCRSTCLPP